MYHATPFYFLVSLFHFLAFSFLSLSLSTFLSSLIILSDFVHNFLIFSFYSFKTNVLKIVIYILTTFPKTPLSFSLHFYFFSISYLRFYFMLLFFLSSTLLMCTMAVYLLFLLSVFLAFLFKLYYFFLNVRPPELTLISLSLRSTVFLFLCTICCSSFLDNFLVFRSFPLPMFLTFIGLFLSLPFQSLSPLCYFLRCSPPTLKGARKHYFHG